MQLISDIPYFTDCRLIKFPLRFHKQFKTITSAVNNHTGGLLQNWFCCPLAPNLPEVFSKKPGPLGEICSLPHGGLALT